MICPKCGNDLAHRTQRAGVKDRLANTIFLKPYLCSGCNWRSYARKGPLRMEAEARMIEISRSKGWRKFRQNWLGYLFAALLTAGAVALALFLLQDPAGLDN